MSQGSGRLPGDDNPRGRVTQCRCPRSRPRSGPPALEKSAQARAARAQARAQLRSGDLNPIEVLRTPHESPAGDLRVEQLLVSLPGIGNTRANALLAAASRSTRRVRSLRARQQQALADALRP
jgi:hypothetical protein